MRRRLALGIALSLALSAAPAFADTVDELRDSPRVSEQSPARSEGYLVWTDDSAERFRAWVLPDGGSKTRLNAAGTQSFSSSIDGTAIAFDEYTRRDADIR